MEGIGNSSLPAKVECSNMEHGEQSDPGGLCVQGILVVIQTPRQAACDCPPWWNTCRASGGPLLLFGGAQSCLSFHCILPHPTAPSLGILKPTCLANDHKFLITTFRSLGQRTVSPVLLRWESGRPQLPRDCLWGLRVGCVSNPESWLRFGISGSEQLA